MSTRLREALDLLQEVQQVQDPIAQIALMNLWLEEFSPMTPVLQEIPIVLTPTATSVVKIPTEGQNNFPVRTKAAKKLVQGTKIHRTLLALQAFPEGVFYTDFCEVVDQDLTENLSSTLNYLAKHGYIRRRQVVGQDRAGATRELWKFWPRTEADGTPNGIPKRP